MTTKVEIQKRLTARNKQIKELKLEISALTVEKVDEIYHLETGSVVKIGKCEDYVYVCGYIDHGDIDKPKIEFVREDF